MRGGWQTRETTLDEEKGDVVLSDITNLGLVLSLSMTMAASPLFELSKFMDSHDLTLE